MTGTQSPLQKQEQRKSKVDSTTNKDPNFEVKLYDAAPSKYLTTSKLKYVSKNSISNTINLLSNTTNDSHITHNKANNKNFINKNKLSILAPENQQMVLNNTADQTSLSPMNPAYINPSHLAKLVQASTNLLKDKNTSHIPNRPNIDNNTLPTGTRLPNINNNEPITPAQQTKSYISLANTHA